VSKEATSKADATPDERQVVSVATHHKAPHSIARIRSWFALGSTTLVVALGWGTGMSGTAIASRAVLAGLLGYIVGWAVGVGVWRELVKAEVIAAVRRAEARRSR
jgi:hypothetical protein